MCEFLYFCCCFLISCCLFVERGRRYFVLCFRGTCRWERKYLGRTACCSHNSLKCQGACLDCRSSLKGKKQRDRKNTGEEFELARVAWIWHTAVRKGRRKKWRFPPPNLANILLTWSKWDWCVKYFYTLRSHRFDHSYRFGEHAGRVHVWFDFGM